MNIGIMGAGVIGLAAALNFVKAGHTVTIIEESEDYAGLASSKKIENIAIEKFYHHIFTTDHDFISLADELGLGEQMLWIEPKNAIYINKKNYPFSTPMDLLRFRELSFLNRIKMGLAVLKAKNVGDFMSLETTSAKDWIVQNAGNQSYDKVFGPLLNSKFDVDAKEVSAVWIWNKFKLRGSTRSKNGSKELLGYMKGGFDTFYHAFVQKLQTLGVKLQLNSKITKLETLSDGSVKVSTEKDSQSFDKVLLTFAPEILKGMQTPFSATYLDILTQIKYKSNICMVLKLKNQMTPYYWITIADKNIPFVLLVEQTNFVSPANYNGHIVYLSRYIDAKDPLYNLSNQEIERLFIDGLKQLYPDFREDEILEKFVTKAKYAQPVVVQKYSKLRQPLKSEIPNIFIANMTSIYPEDRGQNYCAKLGKEVSNLMMEG